jgi:hypothetical protein
LKAVLRGERRHKESIERGTRTNNKNDPCPAKITKIDHINCIDRSEKVVCIKLLLTKSNSFPGEETFSVTSYAHYDENSLYSKCELMLQASIVFIRWEINTVEASVTLR